LEKTGKKTYHFDERADLTGWIELKEEARSDVHA